LFALEQARAVRELGRFRERRALLRRVPRGDGHGVLVFPGFLAGDYSTAPLRHFLRALCYDARGWKLGSNLGPDPRIMDRLAERLRALCERHGRKVSLVGWSLGGIYARELARAHAARVRRVITLGAPFRDITATHAARFITVGPERLPARESQPIRTFLRQPVPVASTSIYSRRDGIVHWKSCLDEEAPESENVEVHCSHTGMGFDPEVLEIIADRLAQPEGEWAPYEAQPHALAS